MKTYTLNLMPCEKLCEITKRFGPDIAQDSVQTRALLNDFCGQNAQQFRSEIFCLTSAVEELIPTLLSTHANEPMEIVIARMSKRLHDHRGLDIDLANWTVASWALALEIWDSAHLNTYLQTSQRLEPPAPASLGLRVPSRTAITRLNLGKASLVSHITRTARVVLGKQGRVIAASLALVSTIASLGAISVRYQRARAIDDRQYEQKKRDDEQSQDPRRERKARQSDTRLARNITNDAVKRLIVLQSKSEQGALTRMEAVRAQSSIRPQLRQADDLAQQAIQQDQHDQEAWELSARVRYYLGDYSGAEARVNDAILLFPNDSNLPTLRTRIQMMRNKQMRSTSSQANYIPDL